MTELDVPKVQSLDQLHADHGHLGLNGRDLYANNTVYTPVDYKQQMAYDLEQLETAIRHTMAFPAGPRQKTARATAQACIDKVKAAARRGARVRKGQSA
ncbi:hypothetical protein ACFQ60_17790 [Streptomyces zhihengii]